MNYLIALLLVGLYVVAYLSRRSLDGYFGKKGENQAMVEDLRRLTKEVESVKAVYLQQQARFSAYHQKQFEVIGGVYARLVEAQARVAGMVHPIQFGGDAEEVERRSAAVDAYNDLVSYYYQQKLYLPRTACGKCEPTILAIRRAMSDYREAKAGATDDSWVNAHNTMANQVPALLIALEDVFRALVSAELGPE